MAFLLNEAPNRLLAIFMRENNQAHDIVHEEKIAFAYPKEAEIFFNEEGDYYFPALKSIYADENLISKDELPNIIAWQVRQVYRMVNSLIGSTQNIFPFLDDVRQLKKELQEEPELKALIENIKLGKIKPDIICSGHGLCREGCESVQFDNLNSSVVTYVPPSMMLSFKLGWDIENSRYEDKNLIFLDTYTNKKLKGRSLKKTFSIQSDSLPNYTLFTMPDLSARLIETQTGKILATPTSITLNEIIKQYPDRKLHWAACAEMLNINDIQVGKFAGLMLDKDESFYKTQPTHTFFNNKKRISTSSSYPSKQRFQPY